MTGVVRENDMHIGHGKPTEDFHQSSYVASLNNTVFANGKLIIVVGDTTACGDVAIEGSSKLFVNGRAVHRIGDATGGHGEWIPNAALSGSGDVIID